MDYEKQIQKAQQFQALTSLLPEEFEHLLEYFEVYWSKYFRQYSLDGKKRNTRSYKEHGNAVLKGSGQKLFFLLVYLKNNPLQAYHAACFGISQSKVSSFISTLLGVLSTTLEKMDAAPSRMGEELQERLKDHKTKAFYYDGTEREIQRNKDQEAQEYEYSGKKKAMK